MKLFFAKKDEKEIDKLKRLLNLSKICKVERFSQLSFIHSNYIHSGLCLVG